MSRLQLICVLFQIRFPSWLSGTPTSPEAQLKQLIQSCLHTASQQRPSASRVQELLFEIMVHNGWSNSMCKTGRKYRENRLSVLPVANFALVMHACSDASVCGER